MALIISAVLAILLDYGQVMKLSTKIFIGMALGVVVGTILNLMMSGEADGYSATVAAWLVEYVFDSVGEIFISSLMLMVVPLVFVSLVCGSAAMGQNARMGVMAAKTTGLYVITTALAISLALLIANVIDPGVGVGLGGDVEFQVDQAPSAKEVLIGIIPSNPVQAMATGNMLQIIAFSIILGIAITHAGSAGQRTLEFFESFNEVVMTMVTLLMKLAPYGVFCLLAKLFSQLGVGAIVDLAKYFVTVLLVLLLHSLGVYSLMLRILARLNPIVLFRNIRPMLLFGFSTASSNATIPVTLNVVEKRLGVDNSVASFTVPLGATINMDGTAIMQGVATVFIAQAYGIDISLMGYLTVIAMATLASVGTAGVPSVGLITLSMVLVQVGLPVEGVALIIGADRLLDMVRTAVNLAGDAVVSVIVAKSEGLMSETVFYDTTDGDALIKPQADVVAGAAGTSGEVSRPTQPLS